MSTSEPLRSDALLPTQKATQSKSGRPSSRLLLEGASLAAITLAVLTLTRVLTEWPPDLWIACLVATVVGVVGSLVGLHPKVAPHNDRLLTATVAFGGAIAVVLGLFLVVVVGLGRIPRDDERSLIVLAMVAAAAGALLFGPLRAHLTRRASRLLSLGAPATDDVLTVFSRRIARDVPIDEVLLQAAETLRRSMQLSVAEIWAGEKGRLTCITSVPEQRRSPLVLDSSTIAVAVKAGVVSRVWLKVWMPDVLVDRHDDVRVVPLAFSGELLGLIIAERSGTVALTPAQEETLAELGRRLSLALHNTQLDHALQETLEEVLRQSRELEASRRRLVSASDEERRRIERDLHDGAQQHLVALSVGLNLAIGMVEDDPTVAAEMLTDLQGSVSDTIEELRSLAHGIYPPLLRDGGLEPALRAAASRSPLDVVVDTAVDRSTPEIEAAVYFCCLEALQNAAKHAPGSHVSIRAWLEAGGLLFEVTDDGPGFDSSSVAHSSGYTNMADRLGAIGGRVEWRSGDGDGTTVAGSVPLV